MVRRVLCMVLLLAACSGTNEPSSASGVTLPLPPEPETLLPVPDDTQPPDVTDSIPPDALFGGDLCTSLEEPDFAGVDLGGRGAGHLTSTGALSIDSCQYLLSVGSHEYEVMVQVQSPADFRNPATSDQVVDEIDGLGLAARGLAHTTAAGDEYEVIVKVDNGFFSVTAPDKDSALALAAKAVPRALHRT
jgi:hypothetical protein